MLKPKDTIGILKLGGTILGTTNKGHFAAKVGKGDIAEVPAGNRRPGQADDGSTRYRRAHCRRWRRLAHHRLQLYREGWPIIGVPKTIDNDLSATAITFGFDSAVATA